MFADSFLMNLGKPTILGYMACKRWIWFTHEPEELDLSVKRIFIDKHLY